MRFIDQPTPHGPGDSEVFFCEDCEIEIVNGIRTCPQCGKTMWTLSQIKGMGSLISLMMIPGLPVMIIVTLAGFGFVVSKLLTGGASLAFLVYHALGVMLLVLMCIVVSGLIVISRRMSRTGHMTKREKRPFKYLVYVAGSIALFMYSFRNFL